MFYKKGVFKNFAKLKGKHLCQSLGPAALLRRHATACNCNGMFNNLEIEFFNSLWFGLDQSFFVFKI